MTTGANIDTGVLAGVRVLDFGRFIAGPFCAALLADLGADVIRIEKVSGSEDRFLQPVAEDHAGAMFLQCNRGKRGLTLNPMKPEGQEIVRKLVKTADVVIANLPPDTILRMGLDYETLREIQPQIILSTVSALGTKGPWANKVGFDGVAQAMSGNAFLTGHADEPMKAWVPYVDFGTAAFSALGIVSALLARTQGRGGQRVEASLLRTALTINNATLIEQHLLHPDRVGSGNRGQTAGPSDVFQTRDGWVLISVSGQMLFDRIASLLNDPGLLDDPRFADDLLRGEHGDVLSEMMTPWFAQRSTEEALAELEVARIPAGPVYSPQQALDDPHIQASEILGGIQYPGAVADAPIAGSPMEMSGTPAAPQGRSPQLGEHTDAILQDLGYDADTIAALHEARVV
ncbi:MAG: Crotonobetainyl-CoA:carnitine CoA-transferase CaiB [Chloroflexi bacterium]|jgi:crotonobetainyl-CoA:carnitine CoA-transferase CaiB-like acyl-CoA transferase|nr:MAG: Crotonobetainyl-CoA:carnitine CoA-transferase CaiB [Chloroflexota bacterium]